MSIANRKSDTHEELFFQIRTPHTGFNGRNYRAATAFSRERNGRWETSIARCSAEDNYNRASGRTIARRAWFNKRVNLFTDNKPTIAEVDALYRMI